MSHDSRKPDTRTLGLALGLPMGLSTGDKPKPVVRIDRTPAERHPVRSGWNMDRLWAMNVFVRVAECGSFSGAATALNMANASVTTCVRNLERHLNVTLIHRDTRRLQLSEEGRMFLVRAREVLQAVEDAEAEVQTHLGELRGPLHIEMPISIGHALLCPQMPIFAERHPEISTSITLTNQPHHVIERAIDVAIRMDRVEDESLVARPLYEARYVLCCTPQVAKQLPGHPSDLDPRRCMGMLAEERRHANPWQLERDGEQLTIKPQGALAFNSSDALIVAALRGAGVVHLLDVFANRYLATGELVAVYTDWNTVVKTFYAVMAQPRAGSAKVRAFIDFLREVLDSERRPSSSRPVLVKAIGKR